MGGTHLGSLRLIPAVSCRGPPLPPTLCHPPWHTHAGRRAQAPAGRGGNSLDYAGSRLPGALLSLLAGGPGGWVGGGVEGWPVAARMPAAAAAAAAFPTACGCQPGLAAVWPTELPTWTYAAALCCQNAPPRPTHVCLSTPCYATWQAHLVYEVRELAEIKHFCNHKLGLRWGVWGGGWVGGWVRVRGAGAGAGWQLRAVQILQPVLLQSRVSGQGLVLVLNHC